MKNLHDFPAILLMLLIISLPITVTHAEEWGSTRDLPIESKVDLLIKSLYCYCGCARETLQQCVCEVSQQLKNDFRNQLAAGTTVEQLRNDYIAAHGTQYSAIMPVKGFNIVAYIMPAIIIVLLGVIVFIVLKSKRESQLARQRVPVEKKSSASNDLYNQIEAEIESYKRQR